MRTFLYSCNTFLYSCNTFLYSCNTFCILAIHFGLATDWKEGGPQEYKNVLQTYKCTAGIQKYIVGIQKCITWNTKDLFHEYKKKNVFLQYKNQKYGSKKKN